MIPIEMVLPSGRFARIENARGEHLLKALRADTEGKDTTFYLISLLCTIDGEAVSYQDLLDMDLRDALALQRMASKLLGTPIQERKS